MALKLPNKLDKDTVSTFVAGMLSLMVIKLLVSDVESFIINLFPGGTSKWIMALVLIVIIYLLFRVE